MLIICDKPALAESIHKSTKISFCSSFNSSFMYEFDYSNYIYKGKPNYKVKKDMTGLCSNYLLKNGNKTYLGLSPIHSEKRKDKELFLSEFNEICFVLENDYSSVRSFDLVFNDIIKIGDNLPFTCMFIKLGLDKLSSEFTKRQLCNGDLLKDYTIDSYRNAYLLKDYIDYHFNNLMFKKFKMKLTRNMIWALVLHYQFDKDNSVSIHELLRRFASHNLGSVASRHPIIESLVRYSFLNVDDGKYKLSKLSLKLAEEYGDTLFNIDYFENFAQLFKQLNNGSKVLSFEILKPKVDNYLDLLKSELNLDISM